MIDARVIGEWLFFVQWSFLTFAQAYAQIWRVTITMLQTNKMLNLRISRFQISRLSVTIALLFLLTPSMFKATQASAEPLPQLCQQLCQQWRAPRLSAELSTKQIDEDSGLAVSKQNHIIYHVNDSGSQPVIFVSKPGETTIREVNIASRKWLDAEDLAIGRCAESNRSCLVIGDIGDNRRRRREIQFHFVPEAEFVSANPDKAPDKTPETKVEVESILRVRYPDHAHDAEAFSLYPNGDIIIITKEFSDFMRAEPAAVFRVSRAQYENHQAIATAQKLFDLDIPSIVGETGLGGLVTAMSATSDGSRFLILTYRKVVEFALNLSSAKPGVPISVKAGVDYQVIDVRALAQQEGIAYDENDRDFFYTTEVPFAFLRALPFGITRGFAVTPLMKVECENSHAVANDLSRNFIAGERRTSADRSSRDAFSRRRDTGLSPFQWRVCRRAS